eukprot:5602288-Heterocapsa_arctica.AAC.1
MVRVIGLALQRAVSGTRKRSCADAPDSGAHMSERRKSVCALDDNCPGTGEMCPVVEGSNVSAPTPSPLREGPSEPGGVLPGGSFEDRTGTMPQEYGSPYHPLLIEPTIAAPEGERTMSVHLSEEE